MKTLNVNTQVLNVHFKQSLTADILNKINYNLFTAGVIEGDFDYSPNTVTINSVSFLIHPQNQTDILVRIDTTVPVTIENTSTTNIYLVARYRWENENIGAEFLFVDDATVVDTDVILVGLVLNENGEILFLDYDVQERSRLNIIQKDTIFPLISKLDGYSFGHDENEIPISDGALNTNLNAELFNGKNIEQYVVSKELSINTIDSETGEPITSQPIYPDWMDVESVNRGDGVTAETLMGERIQPQDGITKPTQQNQIPVANTVLQRNLNAQLLNGSPESKFAKTGHVHNYDDILEGLSGYYRVTGIENNLITDSSIADDSIDYRKVHRLAYDSRIRNRYQPIYETGYIDLTGVTESTVTFNRSMNHPVVILQRLPATTPLSPLGSEKRTARITSITNTQFKAKQMGEIEENTTTYKRNDAHDTGANRYFYMIIGEKDNAS